jgi:hypothetical protein
MTIANGTIEPDEDEAGSTLHHTHGENGTLVSSNP